MSIPCNILKEHPYLETDTILIGYRGSIAHGMYMPKDNPNSIDDKDIMAVLIPDVSYYLGLKQWGSRGTKEHFIDEYDIVSYEIRKFVSLLLKGNPNVLCMLWLDGNYYLKKTDEGQLLIDNRKLFATKQVYQSFVGYAYGQLHRMTHFRYQGYMGQKRKELVDKYGYDVKNAVHLIRLLRMGIEFLNDGYLYVMRLDAPQLLEIKNGEWSLEQVQEEADRLFKRIETVYDNCTLPLFPDGKKVNDLCVAICKRKLFE